MTLRRAPVPASTLWLLLLAPSLWGAAPASIQPGRLDSRGDPLPPGAVARLGTIRFRHTVDTYMEAVLLSPDAKTLITESNNQVYFWATASGKLRRRLAARERWVDLSPDGKTAAALGADEHLALLDVSSGKEVRRLGAPADKFAAAAFSPDGTALAAGGADGLVSLWETASGKLRTRFADRGKGAMHTLSFSRDGKRLAAAGRANNGYVWDVGTGRRLLGIEVSILTLSPDGKRVAYPWNNQVQVVDVDTRQTSRILQGPNNFQSIPLFSPDGRLVIASDFDPRSSTTYVWEADSGKKVAEYPGYAGALSSDGKMLALWSGAYAVRLCDPKTGKDLRSRRGHREEVTAVAFAPDGRTVATAGDDQSVRLWDTTAWEERRSWTARDLKATALLFSPDGKLLAALNDRMLELRRIATGERLGRWEENRADLLAGRFATAKALRVAFDDGTVRTWDVAAARQGGDVQRLQTTRGRHERMVCAIFALDGRLVIAAPAKDGPERDRSLEARPACRLDVWDFATGKQVCALRPRSGGDAGRILALAFSPDGQTLASASAEGDVRTWDLVTGRERHVLRGASERGSALAFSPDSRWLAFGGTGHTVRLCELATGQEAENWHGHQGPIGGLAFAPDGRALVSASADGTALVWDLTAGAARVEHKAEELDQLWRTLARGDAAAARRASLALAAAPGQTVSWMRKCLPPSAPAEARHIRDLIVQLDSKDFTVREKATRELPALGPDAERALRQALAARPSLEARRRIEQLLQDVPWALPPAQLQALRAVGVLERIATPEARQVLEALARGDPEARLTREVKVALQRLSKRSDPR